jgi:predicted DNA-binding transcriptional regulator AlpA
MTPDTAKADRPRNHPLPPVPSFLIGDALLTAREAAAYRRQGLSTFWRDVRNGNAPQPVRLMPKTPRWRLADLTAGGAT